MSSQRRDAANLSADADIGMFAAFRASTTISNVYHCSRFHSILSFFFYFLKLYIDNFSLFPIFFCFFNSRKIMKKRHDLKFANLMILDTQLGM